MGKYDRILNGKTKIHFIGIGGSGMFPLVQILHAVGYEITGSDVNEGDIIDRVRKMGIEVHMGHSKDNIKDAQLVVYTAAVMKGNPEVEHAKRLGIETVERSILLACVTNTYTKPICISGTHGKTTTTAMTTQIMVMAEKDPAAVIGGKLPLIDAYGRFGLGNEIIVEACEYNNTFLHLEPYYSVILNIDEDHMEFFKNMDNLKNSFKKFAKATTETVIANVDDEETCEVVNKLKHKKVVSFARYSKADYMAINVKQYRASFFSFDVAIKGTPSINIELNVPGEHNILNSLAAFAAANLSGCTPLECKTGLEAFKGAGRRFEFLGEINSITIADDYAHHPTELEVTLNSAKKMDYNNVWAVFQPFTYTRTANLLNDFARVLKIADKVVMTEIMGGREDASEHTIRTKDLADKIEGSVWFNTFDEVVNYVMLNAKPNDLVITLGCGDIYKAAKKMINFQT